jgi:hypothetical protein
MIIMKLLVDGLNHSLGCPRYSHDSRSLGCHLLNLDRYCSILGNTGYPIMILANGFRRIRNKAETHERLNHEGGTGCPLQCFQHPNDSIRRRRCALVKPGAGKMAQKSERQKIEWRQLMRGMWREGQNLNLIPLAALQKSRAL